MNSQVFDSFLAIVDDALALAKEAVDSAEKASAPAPQVMLTKVAHSKCAAAAKAIHKSGAFRHLNEEALTSSLESAGETGLIDMMAKLAASAVFPLSDDDVLDGELVEKPASSKAYQHLSRETAIWRQALDEAEDELG